MKCNEEKKTPAEHNRRRRERWREGKPSRVARISVAGGAGEAAKGGGDGVGRSLLHQARETFQLDQVGGQILLLLVERRVEC